MRHRIAAALILGWAALTLAGQAFGQPWPSRPVTLIVPQAPGGANDAVARIVAQKLAEQTGAPFVVDNRPGAGGNIGTAAAAKAARDGYTLLLTVNSAHVINPALYANAGFDPVKDFEPVSPVATVAYLLVAHPAFPPKNVAELIEYARARKGELSYASAGNGTLNHLLGEMLKTQTGIDLLHIPYKGAAASATDVLGGRIPISFQSMPSVVSHIQAGRLKVLGVAGEKRERALPDVPTIGETVKGYAAVPWYGIFAPAGSPREIIGRIHAEVLKAVTSRDVIEKMAAQGAEPLSSTPEQFAAMVREDLPRWASIVKASGARVD